MSVRPPTLLLDPEPTVLHKLLLELTDLEDWNIALQNRKEVPIRLVGNL